MVGFNKFLICGGDERNIYLAKLLSKEGKEVVLLGFDNFDIYHIAMATNLDDSISQADIIISAVPCCEKDTKLFAPFSKKDIYVSKIIEQMTENQLFFAGSIPYEIMQQANKKNIKAYDILKYEEMAVLNAIPTAEGAIQLAMEKKNITLHNSKVLVMGFGRIGKILSKMLHGIGASVYVSARSKSDMANIRSFGYTALNYMELPLFLSEMTTIFNTVPTIILDKDNIDYISQDCLIIDLASKPYGVNFDYTKEKGLETYIASSLPGKVAPATAGLYIKETIESIIEKQVV